MPDLVVSHVAVEIAGQEVLSHVDLTVAQGDCVGVVGETGSGKSLTCRLITGGMPRIGARVVRGQARFGELDLVGLDERGWRDVRGRRVALVPQNSLAGLDPVMSIGRQLIETIRHLKESENERGVALDLLEQVRMPDPGRVMSAYPHQLSGGMRQRVMIALSIVGEPELLIADEPTTAVDVTVQRQILGLISDLRAETGMSVIIVTHDLAVVEESTDHVAVMYAGGTVETGPTADVLVTPGHPYTRALLAARPSARARTEPLVDIKGMPPTPDAWPPGCRFAPRCKHAQLRCEAAMPPLIRCSRAQTAACVRLGELGDAA